MLNLFQRIRHRQRVLEPSERIAEILFGLIMVLTFTGSLSVAEAGRDDVRLMLIGALGCNLAWGIIDAIFYVMGSLAEKGQNLALLRAVREARSHGDARDALAEALPGVVMSVLPPGEVASLSERLRALPEPPARARLDARDWTGAMGVFFIVFLSTFPVALPFLFIDDILPAMRVSNAVAVVLLFLVGACYGRVIGRSPWIVGLIMVGFGSALVAMTIALGG